MVSDDTHNTVPIPHNGQVHRPSTEDSYVRRKLAELALKGDDGTAAGDWAAAHHNTLNAHDRAVAEQQLITLQDAEASRSAVIGRFQDDREATPLAQKFVTNEKVASRNRADHVTAWAGLAWVIMLKLAEAFLVSRYIINSGVFGLNPTSSVHTLFAAAYAVLPLGVGLCWSLYLSRLDGRAQVDACGRLHRKMLLWIPIWVLVFALVIGPYMLTIIPVDDPFDITASWVATTKGLLAGLQDGLQAAAGLTIIGLLISSLIATSAIIATILVNNRQTNAAAHVSHIRKDESFGWYSEELTKLRNEQHAAASVIGQLQGFLKSIDDDQGRFVSESRATVLAIQHQGQIAASKAMLAAGGADNIVQLSENR